MSTKKFRSKLQRQAQTRPLENATDSESLSQYSISPTPPVQTPRTVETIVHEVSGSPEQKPLEDEANLDLNWILQIIIDEAEDENSNELGIPQIDPDYLSTSRSRDSEIPSRLSFIVKEKLHEFAKDLRRRTSQVKEDVIRDLTPEATEEISDTGSNRLVENASLMSLIGLHEQTDDAPEEPVRRFVPSFIDPFSKTYTGWLCFVVAAFLYNAFAIPLRSSYPYQTEANVAYWMLCDYVSDFIYIVDLLFVKPRLTFMRGGITVKNNKEMRKHYLMSTLFKLDIISLLPMDLAYVFHWACGCLASGSSSKDSSFSNPYIVRITKTFSYMIYIIHCNSCVYYMLSAWQAFGQIAYRYREQWYLNKWVYNNQGNAYIRCFYFTSAVATSTGNNPAPTNVIEYVYMTFSWMMGVFVFALLLGQIRDIVSNANKNNEEFRSTMDKALGECKRLELPNHLTERVRSWFLYTWDQQKTLDEKKLVERLPLKLQTDLALSVHYKTLSKVQLFQDADRALLRDLVLKLQPVIFLPGDLVCRKGDVGKEMYIVNQGILEVVGGENNTQVFATLVEGSVFGEISLLAIGGNNRRTANIRSKGYSTLFVLSKEDLNEVIRDYPDAQQLLKRKARKMLKKDENKNEVDPKKARQDLKDKCRVSTEIKTPKMLQAISKLLPVTSPVKKELDKVLERKPKRTLKRWSTIPVDEYSDVSDIELPSNLTSRSLD
ncbi:Tax-2 [Aphelenchoides bicaudatus]|nr:Tax-2 [Aphelenchoides bicaudatus]